MFIYRLIIAVGHVSQSYSIDTTVGPSYYTIRLWVHRINYKCCTALNKKNKKLLHIFLILNWLTHYFFKYQRSRNFISLNRWSLRTGRAPSLVHLTSHVENKKSSILNFQPRNLPYFSNGLFDGIWHFNTALHLKQIFEWGNMQRTMHTLVYLQL